MGELARALGVEINTLIAILPNGALVVLISIYFAFKLILPMVRPPAKSTDHNHPDHVTREACGLKEQRLVADIKLLKKNDDKHDEFKEATVGVLHKLDKRSGLICQHLKIKED